MLCGRECSERPVEHPAGLGDLLLLDEELAVVDPDPRHLVHEDKAALEAVVHLVEPGVGYTTALYLLPSNLDNKSIWLFSRFILYNKLNFIYHQWRKSLDELK